jgi:methylmalonyl-CoA mutase C-terminal domain/subunit
MTQLRILATKLGLDGHDRGLRLIARELREQGAEVIYLGISTGPAEAASAAVQEDVDAIAVSLLSGSHLSHVSKLIAALTAMNAHIPVVCGGLIPQSDVQVLIDMGVADVKAVGTPVTVAAAAILTVAEQKRKDVGVPRP